MKISAKGRNAISLMMDLATNNTGTPIRLKEIAKRQGISEKFLEQVIAILSRAGFVRSIRGPQGGYLLRYAPEEYTVGSILRLTEGELGPVSYLQNEKGSEYKITFRVWQQVDEAINNVVDNITLKDLVEWQTQLDIDQYII